MMWSNAFWFAAGVLCTLAVTLVLRPVLRAAPTARARIPRWGVIAGLAGIALVVGLYLWLGRPELINAPSAGQAAAPGAVPDHAAPATGGAGAPMEAAVAGLEARLAQGQGADEDWELLARSYEFLGRSADAAAARARRLPAAREPAVAAAPARPLSAAAQKLVAQADAARRARRYEAARDAYVKLAARGEMTADTWADYADMSASLHGGKLAGEPLQFIDSALALNPRHPKALWLKASAQHEAGQYAQAVGTWQQLAVVVDPASSDAKLIAANIEEDRRLAGGVAGVPATAATVAGTGGPGGAPVSVSGEVVLADAVKARARAGLTLYIVAKSVDQPGMPVAVLRTTTGQWPFRFKLDDSLAMMPARSLSRAGPVTIEARISQSGVATPGAGDLEGTSGVIDPRASRPLRIVIDRVVN
jgi:cytochrome c-type biogenesis protein CcmH